MSIHSLIRDGRKRLQLSEEQFAEKLGVTRGAVQQWEKEGGTAPRRANQKAVADLLGLTVAQLMGGGSSVEPGPEMGGEVPLLSDVQAGFFTEHVDNFHPGDGGMEKIKTSVPVKQHTFALRVTGDSMEPDFQKGMILIVEPDLDPEPGDYVIAKNGDGETTFKQLIKDGGDWYLKPTNSRYPIKPLGEASIIGVVRSVERKLR
jgi:SOS-response transcriptional repressor LexA